MIRKTFGLLGAIAAVSLVMNTANADVFDDMYMDMPVYDQVGFIDGTEHSTNAFYAYADTTGNDNMFYRATLTDFAFPESFDTLGLMVTNSTETFGSVMLTDGGMGVFDFDATPGEYYANVFGDSGDNLGLYGVQISMVPEMEVWAMMLAGLGLIGYKLRRRQEEINGATPA